MELIEIVAIVLIACVLAFFAAIVLRRRLLLRGGGAVDMSLRIRPHAHSHAQSRGWALGVGRYSPDLLQWYRVFTLSNKPSQVLRRRDLEVSGQVWPNTGDSWAVQAGAMVIDCRMQGAAGTVQLAMSPEAVTGFMSWLESSPPGFTLPGYVTN